jgi:predicted MPP superfamily phosphohydrolase
LNDTIAFLISRTLMIGGARLVFGLLLVAVQAYVLRALLKIIRVQALYPKRERLIEAGIWVFMFVVNVPLALFLLESIINPYSVLLYTPPPRFEPFLRPLSYTFFIWNLGSILLALIAPVAMAAYALVQLVRGRRAPSARESTVDAIDFSRRKFLRLALTAAAAMPFAISAYGAVAALSRRVIERVTVPVHDLPEQLDGLTIVQMSDIHSGVFMTEAQMNNYVNIANDLKPDIVALTGDFVASSNRQVEPFMRAMSKLQARLGVFGCLGNHDMFTQSERLLATGFEAAGFKLLRNENHMLDVDGAALNIIGLDFFQEGLGRGRSDIVLKRLPLDGTKILLLHAPYDFPLVARMGVELTLCGHTHGGQIALTLGDIIITPARLTTMFLAGLFKIGNSHLYVNRGLGTTGPPIRINAPPEITHITLKRA